MVKLLLRDSFALHVFTSLLVSSAAVFWDVMGALRDIPRNGCEGDYLTADLTQSKVLLTPVINPRQECAKQTLLISDKKSSIYRAYIIEYLSHLGCSGHL